jgi:hypothetical protein
VLNGHRGADLMVILVPGSDRATLECSQRLRTVAALESVQCIECFSAPYFYNVGADVGNR